MSKEEIIVNGFRFHNFSIEEYPFDFEWVMKKEIQEYLKEGWERTIRNDKHVCGKGLNIFKSPFPRQYFLMKWSREKGESPVRVRREQARRFGEEIRAQSQHLKDYLKND